MKYKPLDFSIEHSEHLSILTPRNSLWNSLGKSETILDIT